MGMGAPEGAPEAPFVPTPDVAAILHALLDAFERRQPPRAAPDAGPERGARAVRVHLDALRLPAYHSQIDPIPRQAANHQLQSLEREGVLRLAWLPGETGHLLASAALAPAHAGRAFALLGRTPQAARRAALAEMLLGERFRFQDWRLRALNTALDQLQSGRSPAPFSLTDFEFSRDLLTALSALDTVRQETPYRVFSVRVFNDSKRFEAVLRALATLARRSRPGWKALTRAEALRELNLVANPDHLYLHGPWRLVDEAGQALALAEFHPSVGVPAAQAARLQRAQADAPQVICVENPTAFYQLVQHEPRAAALCLWGNPAPACRHLLRCLPADLPLWVWADLDYGGWNIVAQLREQVNPRAAPWRMDVETFEAHAAWARPLSPADVKGLTRLLRRPSLADARPVIAHLLRRGLKLEQEAVGWGRGLLRT